MPSQFSHKKTHKTWLRCVEGKNMQHNWEIYNENCLDTLKRDIEYNYVITSPPDFDEIGENPDKSTDTWTSLMENSLGKLNPKNGVVTVILRDRKSGGTVIRKHQMIIDIMEKSGWEFKSQKIWVRSYNVNLYRFNYSFILTFKKPGPQFKREKGEPTEHKIPDVFKVDIQPIEGYVDNYPRELLYPFIEAYTNPNEIVFDPFVGVGSTALACLDKNRKCVGSEIVKSVYDIAQNTVGGWELLF